MGRPRHPRPGIWSAAPKPLRRTQQRAPDWCGYLLLGPFLIGLSSRSFERWAIEWLLPTAILGIILIVGLPVYWQAAEFLALRVTPADRALSDAPPGLVEFGVEVTLYVSNGTLGVDRGFVWIEDGILTFNGAACSFALASDDFHPQDDKRERHRREIPSNALRLNTPGSLAHIRFVPLHAPRGMAFEYWLGRFLKSVDQSDRPRQWPPLHPYGSLPEGIITGTPESLGGGAAHTGSTNRIVRTKRPSIPTAVQYQPLDDVSPKGL